MTVRILGFVGSVRPGAAAERALRLAIAALERCGATCDTFDVRSLPLAGSAGDDGHSAVAALDAAVAAADGFVIAVAPFHGAIPGILKNAFDHFDPDDVSGKPFAAIGVAYGDAEPAVADVTRVLRHMGAIAGVNDVVVSRAREHWGDGEEPANTTVGFAISSVAEDLVQLSELRAQGRLPGA